MNKHKMVDKGTERMEEKGSVKEFTGPVVCGIRGICVYCLFARKSHTHLT